jgi:acyl-CoA thioester hydrolase
MANAPDRDELRDQFPYLYTMQVRWNDLDAYRHVNNARFYAFFDTIIMHYLARAGGFDLLDGPVVPYTVENMCRFHRSLPFALTVDCALRVGRVGNSSVRYELALFAEGVADVAATGYFIDVFVDRSTERPIAIPNDIRTHLLKIAATPALGH